ncbi:YeeE/YedE family protein [Acinetobacter sp. S40]|uniref:YeeE/YedE family protein n=1 Tax=unclassified Acinetobacter TaxID=196816 RepID=UPI00190DBCDC|nr:MULTISPECIES: YeeE/YedE thiosulfate transporter family protein [unclassified Acinetobacter]MBJ9986665.1 YeeE/YedE family protein [Acinetobacter sp. S40]MBK0063217.1 YeeE/YedE family protein [Acinetobacter sp. S55]MBK0066871.1 YeeE/YedE family protein [Acinetobacter sp. S54]
MHSFLLAFIGGLLLGIAVIGYLYVNGRIAGVSGLLAQAINPETLTKTPAIWFLLGLFITPFFFHYFYTPEIKINSNPYVLILAGLFVGFGTRMGSGCTSGHGICGLSRLSKRSLIATTMFMLAGFITVYVIRHVLGVNQ